MWVSFSYHQQLRAIRDKLKYMTVLIDRAYLRSTITTAKALFYSAWIVQFLALFVEMIWGAGSFVFDLLCLVVFIFIFRANEKIFKKLQYSFWSFKTSLILWNFWLIYNSESVFVQNACFVSAILFFSLCLHMSTPYLYPRLTWWEYDFRFRGDLKIWIHQEDSCIQGRLTDLRKDAACVVMFDRLKPGSTFVIDYQFGDEHLKNEVRVISRREAFFGRGYLYGVKFILDKKSKDDAKFQEYETSKKNFKRLSRLWRVKKKVKRQLKQS